MPVEVFNKFSTVRPIFQSLEKPVDKTNNNRQEWLLKLRYGQFHKDYPTIENPVDSKIFQLKFFISLWELFPYRLMEPLTLLFPLKKPYDLKEHRVDGW